MSEQVQQQGFVNQMEWRLLGLTVIIFLFAEETVRHFGSSSMLETFIACCIAITYSRYVAKDSKGFAISAFQAVSTAAATFIFLTLVTPFLKTFMPTFLAYGLPFFVFVMSAYAVKKLRKKPVRFRFYLSSGLLLAALVGALGYLL